MKVAKEHQFPKEMAKFGNSGMFDYATNKSCDNSYLKRDQLKTWNQLLETDLKNLMQRVPLNGFEEMIRLTEEGKLWHYPIDNEFGLDQEKQVPFEEHVFLDKHLEDFPKHESIRAFMSLVIMGLGNNPYMTSERKRLIIEFYRDYLNSKRETYKQAGFDIDKIDSQ